METEQDQHQRLNLFALSIVAFKGSGDDQTIEHMAAVAKATSEDEATEEGFRQAKNAWPEPDWEFSVARNRISFDWSSIKLPIGSVTIRIAGS